MRRAFGLLLSLLAVAVVVVQSTAAQGGDSPGKDVLEFDVMSPVVAPFTGAAHPIRGVNGGGVPWQIDRGRGDLSPTVGWRSGSRAWCSCRAGRTRSRCSAAWSTA